MDWESHWHWLAPLTAWLGRYALLAALVGSAAGASLSAGSRSPSLVRAGGALGARGIHLPVMGCRSTDGLAVGGVSWA